MEHFQAVVLWLAVYCTYSLELPHSTCTYGFYRSGQLRCELADLDLPYSLNLSLVPSNVTFILLSCPGASQQNQCNIMRGDLQPLPHRNELIDIGLWGFKTDNAQLLPASRARIPVPRFLDNVKHRLKVLGIAYSKIGYLDGEFFRGFQSLESLGLYGNDISSIDVESFSFLMDPLIPVPSAALDVPIPKLSSVNLGANNLQDLDWAVFRPVARTLRRVYVQDQQPGLSSLRRTGQPFSMNFTILQLERNRLREIPASVLDTVALVSGGWLFAVNNNMCSSLPNGDCSCCEMQNLMKWIERNTKNEPLWATRYVQFSCGTGSSSFEQSSAFPLAMFAKCPETDTTARFPHRSCYTPRPLRIECSLGRFELQSSARVTTDAATVIFASDGRRGCDNILYDLHNKVLEMAGVPAARRTGNDAVQVSCQDGVLSVNEADPDASSANKIIFQVDYSLSCQEHLQVFSDFVYALPQNSPENDASAPVLPIDVWLSDFLICTDEEPLVVNCTAGALTSSEKSLTQSPALTLLLYADHSFDCRAVWKSVHEHMLQQEMVQIQTYTYADQEDAVVAVVQYGMTVISENQPSKSTKRNLKYYSAPNRLSRNKFRKLTVFLQSLIGIGTV